MERIRRRCICDPPTIGVHKVGCPYHTARKTKEFKRSQYKLNLNLDMPDNLHGEVITLLRGIAHEALDEVLLAAYELGLQKAADTCATIFGGPSRKVSENTDRYRIQDETVQACTKRILELIGKD